LNRQELTERLEDLASRLSEQGFDVRPIAVEPPATASEVVAVEAAIGIDLPPSYRNALLTLSRRVEFRWFAPEGTKFEEPFRENFAGDLHWSLDLTAQFIAQANSWTTTVFPDESDPYDAVWHHKAAFYEVGNGDYLAFDLSASNYERVTYLSHDDGEGHGHVLASDFGDLLDRWVPLACTGGEDWQWHPFTSGLTTMIEPHSEVGERWRRTLRIGNA
jgi:hypothetical protein